VPSFSDAVAAAKAVADPSRLRILTVLRRHELTVSEVCMVLEQSQPRVSRHLKILVDAGLAVRLPQGTNAFYRLSDAPIVALAHDLNGLVDSRDPVIRRDGRRLEAIRRSREETANEYFERIADEWDEMRARHVADDLVEQALLAACPDAPDLRLLDLGTGTGRVLELFADRVAVGTGIDLSKEMLHLARSKVESGGHTHLRVRHGSITSLDVDPGSNDVAVLHHVLHFLDEPAVAIAEAAVALRPGGTLLAVDFAPHNVVQLQASHAHRRLGVSEDEMERWCADAGLSIDLVQHFRPADVAAGEELTVTLWRAVRPVVGQGGQMWEAAS